MQKMMRVNRMFGHRMQKEAVTFFMIRLLLWFPTEVCKIIQRGCRLALKQLRCAWQFWHPKAKRGEIARQIGEALRAKFDLGEGWCLLRCLPDGIREVQEIIHMCDYAVGLSRQLNGSITPSECNLFIYIHDHSLCKDWLCGEFWC
ncbi:aldehyde dehydrogenase family 7 member A1-like isoform X2 [Lotus japonicus]|nr:aldehyde dehydrogenase family 7 member A1-like isoform X2 [Lotus japonicus]